jgi:TonB family protein
VNNFKHLPAYSIIAFCTISQLFSASTFANTSSKITTIVDAKPIIKSAPKYPINAARQGAEGWTDVSYIIEPDGSVSNVVIENSSGQKSFDNATINAMKKWQFKPATENGKPIQQCKNSVRMSYAMDNANGAVTRRFKKAYSAIQKALNENDLTSAKEQLKTLKKSKLWRLSESNYLNILSANYAKKIGDKKLELDSLNNMALVTNKFQLKDKKGNLQKLALLQDKFLLEITLNKIENALATFKLMEKNPESAPYIEKLRNIEQKVVDYKNSDKPILVNATTGEREMWHHKLARKDFGIVNLKGSLKHLDIRCANKRHLYTFEANNQWHLPEAWQSCDIYVTGEKNSTFDFIELGASSKLNELNAAE